MLKSSGQDEKSIISTFGPVALPFLGPCNAKVASRGMAPRPFTPPRELTVPLLSAGGLLGLPAHPPEKAAYTSYPNRKCFYFQPRVLKGCFKPKVQGIMRGWR